MDNRNVKANGASLSNGLENRRRTGTEKEKIAAEYLRQKGYFIIQTNFRCRQGELDIVARDKATIVFVEVKYRSSEGMGHPLAAVDVRKQRKICRTALYYMSRNKLSSDNTALRFDVIGILGTEITHVEHAFEYKE